MDLDKVDLMTEIDSLRRGWQACEARLAAVEAERDAARAEVEKLREDAARARWCERMKANIEFLPLSNCWSVSVVIGQDCRVVILSDRNAAIDAAMKGGK